MINGFLSGLLAQGLLIDSFQGNFGVSLPVVLDPFVTAIWGQSEHQHILLEYDDALPKEQLVAQDRVTFWWHDRTNNDAAGVQSVTLNDTTAATDTVTAAMVAMGNTFMRQMPSRDIKIIMHTQSGTTPTEIMDDSYIANNADQQPPRRWQDDWALNAAATADGHLVDHPWHSWFAAPGSWGDDYGQNMFAFIKGRDHVTGVDLVYSDTSPLDVSGISVSRTLRDLYPHDPVWVATSGAHVFIPAVDLQNATKLASGGAHTSLTNKEASTQSWRDVIRNPVLSAHFTDEVAAINGYANGHEIGGAWGDQAHPDGSVDAGINRMARQMAYAIMRGANVMSYVVPTITHAEWQSDGSYMEFWSSAGPITTHRINSAADIFRTADVTFYSQSAASIRAGRIVTGSRVSEYETYADWSARTGYTSNLSDTTQPIEIRGVDLGAVQLNVFDGVDLVIEDCRIVGGNNFAIDAYPNANVKVRYCDFEGPADGTGVGTVIRQRSGGTGRLVCILNKFFGHSSDGISFSQDAIVAFNNHGAPIAVPTTPVEYDAATAYDTDAVVYEVGHIQGERSPRVWISQIDDNTGTPDFTLLNNQGGDITNGWLFKNPHADGLVADNASNALVVGNVVNMDGARRELSSDVSVVTGANAAVWLKTTGNNNSGMVVLGNTFMRDPDELFGNPIGPVTGDPDPVIIQHNLLESVGHNGSKYFSNQDSGATTIYAGNVDPADLTTVLAPPTNGVAGVVNPELAVQFAQDYALEVARVDRGRAAIVPAHWTDVVGVEIDGEPAHRAEVQPNGRVRVYPNSGAFTNTTLIEFGRGGASGMIDHDADAFAGLWDDYPIVGEIPLSQLPDPAVLVSTIEGVASFAVSAAGPMFHDVASIGTQSEFTITYTGVFNGSTAADIFNINGSQARLQILSNLSMRLLVKDSSNTTLVNNVYASQSITSGASHTITLSVNLASGYARLWLDDVLVLDASFTGSTGVFTSGRYFRLLASTSAGANQFVGNVERLAVWFAATSDGVLPVDPPYHDIAGDAATVNVDPWKQRGDAA